MQAHGLGHRRAERKRSRMPGGGADQVEDCAPDSLVGASRHGDRILDPEGAEHRAPRCGRRGGGLSADRVEHRGEAPDRGADSFPRPRLIERRTLVHRTVRRDAALKVRTPADEEHGNPLPLLQKRVPELLRRELPAERVHILRPAHRGVEQRYPFSRRLRGIEDTLKEHGLADDALLQRLGDHADRHSVLQAPGHFARSHGLQRARQRGGGAGVGQRGVEIDPDAVLLPLHPPVIPVRLVPYRGGVVRAGFLRNVSQQGHQRVGLGGGATPRLVAEGQRRLRLLFEVAAQPRNIQPVFAGETLRTGEGLLQQLALPRLGERRGRKRTASEDERPHLLIGEAAPRETNLPPRQFEQPVKQHRPVQTVAQPVHQDSRIGAQLPPVRREPRVVPNPPEQARRLALRLVDDDSGVEGVPRNLRKRAFQQRVRALVVLHKALEGLLLLAPRRRRGGGRGERKRLRRQDKRQHEGRQTDCSRVFSHAAPSPDSE